MAEPAYPLRLPERRDAQAWPAQGRWTYENYRRLPDDGRRYEVIRGSVYVTPAPSIEHQRAVTRLFRLLDRFVLEHRLGEVLMAPLDVLLPGDIATPVQPDLVFFRAGNEPRPGAKNFHGVPDLVIEVLSPATRRFDERIKLAAYRDAGVPEVWLADPQPPALVVHGLSEDGGRYVELERGREGGSVISQALPGLRVVVSEVFPRGK